MTADEGTPEEELPRPPGEATTASPEETEMRSNFDRGITGRTTDELGEARRKLAVQMANEPPGLQADAYTDLLARIDRELAIRSPSGEGE